MAEKIKTFIFADLESEGLAGNRILQIAAIDQDNNIFSVYVNPLQELSIECTKLTGLYFFKGQLYKNGQLLPAINIKKALKLFQEWINKHEGLINLVLHNGFTFDIRVLVKHFKKQEIEFPRINGVCDTVPIFKKYKEQIKLNNCQLKTLSEFFECPMAEHHDAVCDSKTLKIVTEKGAALLNIKMEDFLKNYQKPIMYFLN